MPRSLENGSNFDEKNCVLRIVERYELSKMGNNLEQFSEIV